jgi:hypothetical protein
MDKPPEIVKELTPELAGKIWNSIQMKMLGDKLSKEGTLHHLKQLKAQMGKLKSGVPNMIYRGAVDDCMAAIDKKIEKINKT